MNADMIKKIRQFNRYYTVWLDVMNKGYMGTELSWPESRVLFEIHLYDGISATELCGHLGMDKSYVSRILAGHEKNGLVTRELVSGSKGTKKLRLTEAGIKKARQIDESGDKQIIERLESLPDEKCNELCNAMERIEAILRENA